MRQRSTDRQGRNFDDAWVQYVWSKGRPIPNYDNRVWCWDAYGTVMRRSDYGNCASEYGWEIDHIFPVSHGGSDDPTNLQPLQWQNNRQKGDSIVAA